MAWNFIDLTGQVFGHWHVKCFNENTHKWVCECDCENHTVKELTGARLRSGKSKSCGCTKKLSKGNTTRLLGNRYNNLTVISFSHFDASKKDYWKCKCDCGNTTVVQGANLINGSVKSCGCLHKMCNFEDISGSKFGMLTVDHFIERKGYHSYYDCICECGNHIIANANNLKNGHYYSCGCASKSNEENDLSKELKEMFPNVEFKYNVKLLPTDNGKYNKEIDIFIPSLKVGIEYNGSVFHATENGIYKNKDKNYHRDKFLVAKELGIHLISIFDVDWKFNKEKIVAYLNDIIGNKCKLYARKCIIKSIGKKDANAFCDRYHLQGGTSLSSINYGLFYNNELVSVMTFGKLRLKKQIRGHYELHRYCVKSGITILGGANRLFKQFIKEYNPINILSYSNNDYFNGSIYPFLGFKYIKQVAQPYYWYLNGKELKREDCQAKKLEKSYPSLCEEARKLGKGVENYVMTKLKAKKVYRCGNTRWEWP